LNNGHYLSLPFKGRAGSPGAYVVVVDSNVDVLKGYARQFHVDFILFAGGGSICLWCKKVSDAVSDVMKRPQKTGIPTASRV
ncbi:MAG: hypothetical protein O3C34_21450, partial [Proteobacteria bacterium]|nr:hypothetical protein [Pseudomonadota bacterium]